MSRYIDADKLIPTLEKEEGHYNTEGMKMRAAGIRDALIYIFSAPTADVRENITAHKVIGGGEHDGATCWFECSNCHAMVDINDKYCSECGARFEA